MVAGGKSTEPNANTSTAVGQYVDDDPLVKNILGRPPQPPYLAEEMHELEEFYDRRDRLYETKYEELPLLNRLSLLLIVVILLSMIAFIVALSVPDWFVTASTSNDGVASTNKTGIFRFCVNEACQSIQSDELYGQLTDGMPCNRTQGSIATRYWSTRSLLLLTLTMQFVSFLLAIGVNLRPTRTAFVTVIAIMSLVALTSTGCALMVFILTYGTWAWCDHEFCELQSGLATDCNSYIGYGVYICCGSIVVTGVSFIVALVMTMHIFSVKKAAHVDSKRMLHALKLKWDSRLRTGGSPSGNVSEEEAQMAEDVGQQQSPQQQQQKQGEGPPPSGTQQRQKPPPTNQQHQPQQQGSQQQQQRSQAAHPQQQQQKQGEGPPPSGTQQRQKPPPTNQQHQPQQQRSQAARPEPQQQPTSDEQPQQQEDIEQDETALEIVEDDNSGWVYDPNTGYFYSSEELMYYDPGSEMYFDIQDGVWIRYSS